MERRKSSDLARRAATEQVARARARRLSSGLIEWLAKRLGKSTDELLDKIDPDTVRRTKYPVETVENDDGTTTFKDPKVRPNMQVLHAPTTPGSKRDEVRGGVVVKR